MLDSVFGFKVALGLPATVTSPDFVGWTKSAREREKPPYSPLAPLRPPLAQGAAALGLVRRNIGDSGRNGKAGAWPRT